MSSVCSVFCQYFCRCRFCVTCPLCDVDYSIEFLSAVPRVVPLGGGTVRVAIDNLAPEFDLQLLSVEDIVEFEVSDKCSKEICAPLSCICLQFEAPRYILAFEIDSNNFVCIKQKCFIEDVLAS